MLVAVSKTVIRPALSFDQRAFICLVRVKAGRVPHDAVVAQTRSELLVPKLSISLSSPVVTAPLGPSALAPVAMVLEHPSPIPEIAAARVFTVRRTFKDPRR